MAQGLVTTFRHLLRPAITLRYPDQKRELPERSRTSFTLPVDETGTPLCKSCMLCMKNCPDTAIIIESEKKPDGPGRMLTKFTIDLGKCMYCGLCVEQCPSTGLAHTGNYETATHIKEETILVLFDAADAQAPVGTEKNGATEPAPEAAAAQPRAVPADDPTQEPAASAPTSNDLAEEGAL